MLALRHCTKPSIKSEFYDANVFYMKLKSLSASAIAIMDAVYVASRVQLHVKASQMILRQQWKISS